LIDLLAVPAGDTDAVAALPEAVDDRVGASEIGELTDIAIGADVIHGIARGHANVLSDEGDGR